MNHKNRLASLCLAAVLLLSGIIPFAAEAAPAPSYTGKQMDILFLHDTHSHLESFVTIQNGDSATVGGFPQIKTLINEAK